MDASCEHRPARTTWAMGSKGSHSCTVRAQPGNWEAG